MFKKKHVHQGKVIGSRQISWYHNGFSRPYKWTTEVKSVCDECKTPFIVEYDGQFTDDDLKETVIRSKA